MRPSSQRRAATVIHRHIVYKLLCPGIRYVHTVQILSDRLPVAIQTENSREYLTASVLVTQCFTDFLRLRTIQPHGLCSYHLLRISVVVFLAGDTRTKTRPLGVV